MIQQPFRSWKTTEGIEQPDFLPLRQIFQVVAPSTAEHAVAIRVVHPARLAEICENVKRNCGACDPLRSLMSIPVLRNKRARQPLGVRHEQGHRPHDSFRACIDNACSGRLVSRISFF